MVGAALSRDNPGKGAFSMTGKRYGKEFQDEACPCAVRSISGSILIALRFPKSHVFDHEGLSL
jgi:hypothetical protein